MSTSQRIFLFRHVSQAGTLWDRYGLPAGTGPEAGKAALSIVVKDMFFRYEAARR